MTKPSSALTTPNMKNLLWFKLAAEMGSMHAAATKLGISQPALSKGIRRLEVYTGLHLLERSAQGVLLTPAGEVLYERAKELQAWNTLFEADIQDLKNIGGALRLGIVPTLTERLLVPTLQTLLNDTKLTVKAHVQLSAALFQMLDAGNLDFVIGAYESKPPSGFQYDHLGQLNSYIVARQGHPLTKTSFTFHDLAQQQWLINPHPISVRKWVEKTLMEETHTQLQPVVEVDTTPSVLSALLANTDLITVLGESTLESTHGKGLTRLPPPAPVWALEIGLFWRRSTTFTQSMNYFRQLIHQRIHHKAITQADYHTKSGNP